VIANQLWRLAKHSAVYGMGAVVARLIGVFLLPVVTRYLTRADVGQTGEENFVVLADPEGNEFCVLGAHSDVTDPPPLPG